MTRLIAPALVALVVSGPREAISGNVIDDLTCLSVLSIFRDQTFESGHKDRLRRYTHVQNKIYLSKPAGHSQFHSSKISERKRELQKSSQPIDHILETCLKKWEMG